MFSRNTSQGHNVLVVLVISHFGFKDRILVLNASVPGHCLLFTFNAVFPNNMARLCDLRSF